MIASRHGQRGRFPADRPLLPRRRGEGAYGPSRFPGRRQDLRDAGYARGPARGMVVLLPEQQELAMEAEPEAFKPAAGAWGRGGSTLVRAGRGVGRMAGADAGMGLGGSGRRRSCKTMHPGGGRGSAPSPNSAIVASTIALSARGVELVADQGFGGGGGGAGGLGADLVDRGALGGGDLVLGHAGAALDQSGGVGSRPGGRCRRPRRGRARSWSRPRRRPGRPWPHIRPCSASASARSCAASSSCSRMPAIFLSSAAPISGRHPLPDQDARTPRPSPARSRPARRGPNAVGSA